MRLESVSSQCESFDRLPQALQTFPGLKTAGLPWPKNSRATQGKTTTTNRTAFRETGSSQHHEGSPEPS